MSAETLPGLAIDVAFFGLLATAAILDVLTFRIPNLIVIALAALFLAAALVAPGPVAWLDHLGAGAAALVCAAILFHFKLLGGGDAKLLAALSLWAGFGTLIPLLIAVSIVGGALALTLLGLRPVFARIGGVAWPDSLRPGHPIPYGIALGAGGIIMRLAYPTI